MKTINLSKVNGKRAIGSGDLKYCNTKYHSPYLAVISPAGEMLWQEKLHSGYGKHRDTFYNVENLKPGDHIQAAGGSGGNKYPFKGKVVELTDTTLTVEEISDADFSNVIAERKKTTPKMANPEMKKIAVMILETEKDKKGNFVPCIVVEGKTGYYTTDWQWGTDIETARKLADEYNTKLGLTKNEAMTLVLKSMRLTHDEAVV